MAVNRRVIVQSILGGALVLTTLLLTQRESTTLFYNVKGLTAENPPPAPPIPAAALSPSLSLLSPASDRYQLTYEQWVKLLAREAAVVAQKQPDQLYILAGDSLSLWFPADLLPDRVTWLNQGISGDTSYGLLRRIKAFDQTQPKTIFLMIGINDLIRGVRYETVVENQREIIRHLKSAHPTAQIVVQSILPHGGDRASQRYLTSAKDNPAPTEHSLPLWVKRLPDISNPSIQRLNQRLALVAQEEKVQFLDLNPHFADKQGNLRDDLTTDGLHLSPTGYALWRSQLSPFLPAQP